MTTKTDQAWQKFGEQDPYFGVLSLPRYRKSAISEADINDFFRSGEEYVDQALTTAAQSINGPILFKSALDFGCGVGRLTIPLAKHTDSIVGIDVSAAMLQEAKSNCQKRGVSNVRFMDSEESLSESDQFDLVHSYIVLQHIPTHRGTQIIRRLIDRITDDGVGIFHITYAKTKFVGRWNNRIRKWVPFSHNVINVIRGRNFFSPMMQMNDYDLNSIFKLVQSFGVKSVYSQYTDHGGNLGVTLYFRKPAAHDTRADAA